MVCPYGEPGSECGSETVLQKETSFSSKAGRKRRGNYCLSTRAHLEAHWWRANSVMGLYGLEHFTEIRNNNKLSQSSSPLPFPSNSYPPAVPISDTPSTPRPSKRRSSQYHTVPWLYSLNLPQCYLTARRAQQPTNLERNVELKDRRRFHFGPDSLT